MDKNGMSKLKVNLFLKTRGLEARQENGQRIIYPLKELAQGIDLPKGTEVFIGRIPRDVFEDELLPIFERAGPVYKFRLMMDFSGSNRGFGFAQYTTRAAALNAINQLDQYEIRPNNLIGVVESLDNCRLFLDNLPPNVSSDAIEAELSKVTSGVKQVIIPIEKQKPGKLHAFVEYENHRSATMARRYLVPGDHIMFGRKIEVDWAKPEIAIDNRTLKSSTLYIGNLNRCLSNNYLERVFSLKGFYQLTKLERVTITSVFATYKERQHALDMYETINYYKQTFNPIADAIDKSVTVSWATHDMLAHWAVSELINISSPLSTLSAGCSPSSSKSSPTSSKSSPASSLTSAQSFGHFNLMSL